MLLFAYLVLSLFPIIGTYLVATAPPERLVARVSAVFFGGLMFLPQSLDFDLPGWPPVGKFELAPTVCLVGSMIAQSKRHTRRVYFSGAALFIWIGVIGWFFTVSTNRDVLTFGPTQLPALKNQDAMYAGVTWLMTQGASFFVARAMHRSTADIEDLLYVVTLIGITQIPLCLYELRMSPQLHRIFYGYSVLNFQHVKRGDGFKPTAFTTHGLHMAIFLFTAVTCSAVLKKVNSQKLKSYMTATFLSLWALLLVSKNVGANVFALIALAVIFWTSPKFHLRVVWVIVGFVILYPYLRSTGQLDVYGFVDWIAERSPERAQSLGFRFINEDAMLARALERPWFGWGGYGRNYVFKETGTTDTIPDGAWIIAISMRGLVGLIGLFGMLILPLIGWGSSLRRLARREQQLLVGLILIATFGLLDLIPNGIFGPSAAYLAGAVQGVKDFRFRRPA